MSWYGYSAVLGVAPNVKSTHCSTEICHSKTTTTLLSEEKLCHREAKTLEPTLVANHINTNYKIRMG